MNRSLVVFVACMVLFAKAIEISKEDKAEKISMRLSKKESQSQLNEFAPDVEKSTRIDRGFEKMVQLVNVLGQMDNFFYDKTKDFIRKLNAMYDIEDENKRQRRTCINSLQEYDILPIRIKS